jgi:uncharacterized membrane protein
MQERHRRSLIKAISWRVLATFATMTIVFIFTRKWVLSLEVGALEVVLKLLLYYAHERFWGRVKWGKTVHSQQTVIQRESLRSPQSVKIS